MVHIYIIFICWQSWDGQFLWQSFCTLTEVSTYITVRNLNSLVSGKARACMVLGKMPSVRKNATLAQSDQWQKERRLRLHHACIAHVVDMVNRLRGEDKHLLCGDGQVHTCFMYCTYNIYSCKYIVYACIYIVFTCDVVLRT